MARAAIKGGVPDRTPEAVRRLFERSKTQRGQIMERRREKNQPRISEARAAKEKRDKRRKMRECKERYWRPSSKSGLRKGSGESSTALYVDDIC